MLEIPSFRKGDTSLRKDRKIPYNILQTFKYSEVHPDIYKSSKTWIDKNPEYDYYFYDDRAIAEYILSFDFDQVDISREEFMKAYRKVVSGAGRADLFRYLVLYEKGGVYVDIDTVCLKPLDSYIREYDEIITGIHGWAVPGLELWFLLNDYMIYTKNHPFVKKAIEYSVKNVLNETPVFDSSYCGNVFHYTGPPCIDMAAKHVLKRKEDFTLGEHEEGGYRYRILDCNFINRFFQDIEEDYDGVVSLKYNSHLEHMKVLKTMNMTYWDKEQLFYTNT